MRTAIVKAFPYANVRSVGNEPTSATSADRLGPEDWTRAALAAIAEKGTANVSVERIAKQLGATKGSFYWHFKDRSALIDAALAHWEAEYTDRIIERLSDLPDPSERFRRLLESTFDEHPGVVVDANLLAAAAEPAVGAVLARVARKRLAFVDRIFAELEVPGGSDRALLAFTAYIGLAQLRRAEPGLLPTRDRSREYVDNIVAWLLGT
jgi:AcrR family transcriptional regulator